MFKRPWVWIPAMDTGWTPFYINLFQKSDCFLEKINNKCKRGQGCQSKKPRRTITRAITTLVTKSALHLPADKSSFFVRTNFILSFIIRMKIILICQDQGSNPGLVSHIKASLCSPQIYNSCFTVLCLFINLLLSFSGPSLRPFSSFLIQNFRSLHFPKSCWIDGPEIAALVFQRQKKTIWLFSQRLLT